MEETNGTNPAPLFIYEQFYKVDFIGVTKAVFIVLVSLFFVYVNSIMLYALGSKTVFFETPRYILFAHMLLNDSILLLNSTVLFALSLAFLQIVKVICYFLVLISSWNFQNAPLTLALMSLERYVAICFPLQHSSMVTQKSTGIALGCVWVLSSLTCVPDIIFTIVTDPSQFLKISTCSREMLFAAKWQADKAQGLQIFYFVTVTVVILFTYVSIIITARSVSSNKESAKKAHNTVLLHLIQLGLCLSSFLYATIEKMLFMMTGGSSSLFSNLRFFNFLIILILPRCMSPLIYGLRDDAVRPLFRYYFCYRTKKAVPVVNVA